MAVFINEKKATARAAPTKESLVMAVLLCLCRSEVLRAYMTDSLLPRVHKWRLMSPAN